MNHIRWTCALLVFAFSLTPGAGAAQVRSQDPGPPDRAQVERGRQDRGRGLEQHRDRIHDREKLNRQMQDGDRDRDRAQVPDFAKLGDRDIYGSELMSARERDAYRQQLQNATSSEERQRVEAQHRKQIEARAQARGVDVIPPGKGIYGGAIMSVEERNRFREQLRDMGSAEERRQYLAQHREEIRERAQAQGMPLEHLEEIEEAE